MSTNTQDRGSLPPALKKTKVVVEDKIESDPCLLSITDIWVHRILPFLGPGHFLYVALVNKRFKELYLAYFSKLKKLPLVEENYEDFDNEDKIQAIATNTFYSTAFSSVACAKYWNTITKEEIGRLSSHWVCPTVAKYGNIEVLKWARLQGFPWDEATCDLAARNGHLEVLKYAHEKGCEWNEWTCAFAAENGHLEVLKYARSKYCPWDVETCNRAAANGHLEILKYAHANGCPWDEDTCAEAAEYGHLEVLKYAHEKRCPWDDLTCMYAARKGHLEVLKYAHEQGCPWLPWGGEDACNLAAENGHLEILKYIRNEGGPWNEELVRWCAQGNIAPGFENDRFGDRDQQLLVRQNVLDWLDGLLAGNLEENI